MPHVFNAVVERSSVGVERQRIRRTRHDLFAGEEDVDAGRNALQQVSVRSVVISDILQFFTQWPVAERSKVDVLSGDVCLFVCQFVCLLVNTISSERLNVG